MNKGFRSFLAFCVVELITILLFSHYVENRLGVYEGMSYNVTRFGFFIVFYLLLVFSWGNINDLIHFFKNLFSKKEKSTDERTGASVSIIIGVVLGFVWGIFFAFFNDQVSIFSTIKTFAFIGFVIGLILFILVRFNILLFSKRTLKRMWNFIDWF